MFVAKKLVGYVFTGIGLFSLFSKDLYLNRDINYDYLTIKSHNNSNLLYIFPEGTCFNNFTKKKSNEFIENNNLIKYKYHLYPRLTGLFTLLKNHHKYKIIYDLTVMYDTIPKNDLGKVYKFYHFFYKYNFPTRVFINIKKYDIDNITNFDKKIEYIFNKKDLFIKKFDINHNQFYLLNYNFFIGFNCFMISLFIFIYSLYLFFNYSFIKTLYSSQLILYFIHFYFFF
jgi:hypothetical protein